MKALMLLVLKRAFSISFDSTELFYEIAFVIECAIVVILSAVIIGD